MRGRERVAGPSASLRIDGDDLTMDLLPELERSFGVMFERDLRQVVTVGDLHALVCGARARGGWTGEGAGCTTQMAFYRLRALLRSFGVGRNVAPDTSLDGLGLPSPRTFKALAERGTGLMLPALTLGWPSVIGCLAVPTIAVLGWLLGSLWIGLAGVPILALVTRSDEGRWTGAYASLRSLATRTAALNYRAFVAAGARNGEREVWIAIVELLVGLGVSADRIGPESRLLA